MEKEFLYVGHYITTKGEYMLKIGTINDPKRRAKEHERNYKKASQYKMPPNGEFIYDWVLPLSKYNTLRYEDANRKKWQSQGVGIFVRKDRFLCDIIPQQVEVTIKKTYLIPLKNK